MQKKRGRGGEWETEGEGERGALSHSGPGLFYLSMTNSSIHSLLSSPLFPPHFLPPYLLSQLCITCHFRIMSPHVYNDIAFVLQITLGFSVSLPTHKEAGIKIYPASQTHTQTHMYGRKWEEAGWIILLHNKDISGLKGKKMLHSLEDNVLPVWVTVLDDVFIWGTSGGKEQKVISRQWWPLKSVKLGHCLFRLLLLE